ncbi:MAG TPA: AAA family ATPase [Polyangiaceae bacterium]
MGRAPELAHLVEGLASARAGRGCLFLLSGEPGIGKTRLAEEVSRQAEAQNAHVVWGSAWDGGGAPAYWPWIQIVRGLRPILPELGEALRRDLGPLWGDEVEATDEEAEARQFRRCDALRAVISIAAQSAPLVLVLDDLHAADRGTLTALLFLSRGVRTLPLLVIGTHREAEARKRPEIGALIDRIGRDGSRLGLRRLRREDVAELTRELEPLAPSVVDRVYETSGGNPFFAKEVLRLVRTGAGSKRIPDAVRTLVTERLRELDDEARDALEAMAVIGRETPVDVLARVCGKSRHELYERLAGALLSGIVERSDGDRLAFSHPLFRECLYDDVRPVRRARLHLRAADTHSRHGVATAGQAESVARHLLLALPEGDPARAIAQARSAAKICEQELAFDRAVELLEGAANALADTTDEGLRGDLELSLAEVLVLVGEGERSRAICATVAERARRSFDAPRLAHAALVYGAEIRVAVVDALQIELLESALRLLGTSEPALRARVLARLAGARQPSPDPQSPVEQAFEAIALARTTNDADTLLHALYTGGAALTGYAPPARRRDVSKELAELAMERHDLVRAQRGYVRWAIDAAELGDAEEMRHVLQAEERLGRMLGHVRFRWQSALLASMHALIEGRFDDSDRAIDEAARRIAELEDPRATSALIFHRVGALRAKMRPTEADPELQFSGLGRDALLNRLMDQLGTVSVHARLGDLAKARSLFDNALPLPEFLPVIPNALMLAAEAAARVEHAGVTRRLLPHLEALPFPAVSWGASGFVWEGFTRDVVGRAHAVLGNYEAAVRALESAIDAAELFGARPAVLESQIALASTLLRRAATGDADRARSLLDRAEARAEELFMPGSLQRIAALREASPSGSASEAGIVASRRPWSFALVREGEVWSVATPGRTARFKHSRAFEILKELVDHPGREFHALDLSTKNEPDAAADRGDQGELLDATAVTQYRKRSTELRVELDEALRWNDSARRERIQAELEFLEDELRRGVGLGGRLKRAGSAKERARVNVHKRLKGAIERIATELPELGEHLEASIITGVFVSYRPRD